MGKTWADVIRAGAAVLPLLGCSPQTLPPRPASSPVAVVPTGISSETQQPVPLTALHRSPATCVFFVGTDCPISNAYAPEIARIIGQYAPQGVAFYVIYAERDLSPATAAEHATAFGFPCPAVLDPQLELARALGATRMPEVVVLIPDGTAVYQGRIDDRYPAPGAPRREHPTSHDLRDALDAFLTGKPIATPRTPAVGCPLDLP
ncbi:MAG: redoxin family protein [Pirellulales bacterium]